MRIRSSSLIAPVSLFTDRRVSVGVVEERAVHVRVTRRAVNEGQRIDDWTSRSVRTHT